MMLIQRHYLKEFVKLFAILAVGLSLTFSLFALIQRLDDFMPQDPSLASLAGYALLKFPQYVISLMPVACLLCSLYTISYAARANEVVAVMAAGGRVRKLFAPFIAAGLALSLLGFVLSEFVVPGAARKAQRLDHAMRGAQAVPTLFKDGVLWFRADDGSIARIEHYLAAENTYGNVSIFRTKNGRLTEILKAREVLYLPDKNTWRLTDVKRYDAGSGNTTALDESYYPLLGSPDILTETAQKPAAMGVTELYRYVRRLREAGFKNLRLSVDLHSKVSYPLINFLMVLIGISFPVRRNMGGFVATAIGLLISLAYWFGYTMSLSLGYAGILPPIVAAWLMPVVAGSAGIYLFKKIPE